MHATLKQDVSIATCIFHQESGYIYIYPSRTPVAPCQAHARVAHAHMLTDAHTCNVSGLQRVHTNKPVNQVMDNTCKGGVGPSLM